MNKTLKYLGIFLMAGIFCSMLYQQFPAYQVKNRFLSNLDLKDAVDNDFASFMAKFKKGYSNVEEFIKRRKIFNENKKIVEEHNSNAKQSFTLAVNKFADWTKEEFEKLLTYKTEIQDGPSVDLSIGRNLATADSIDWRTLGAVSPIQNQGTCGGCYAFASAAAIEGIYQIQHSTLYTFSYQQILDCSGSYGCYGCNGGIRSGAFKYIYYQKLQTLATYPWVGYQKSYCGYSSANGIASTTGYSWVTQNSTSALMAAVSQQPVTITIDASQSVFQLYSSGIIDSASCYTYINHSVLVVGYGTDSTSGVNYWIVKNSWGTSWGESGYVRITRDTTNSGAMGVCGVLYQPLYPLIA